MTIRLLPAKAWRIISKTIDRNENFHRRTIFCRFFFQVPRCRWLLVWAHNSTMLSIILGSTSFDRSICLGYSLAHILTDKSLGETLGQVQKILNRSIETRLLLRSRGGEYLFQGLSSVKEWPTAQRGPWNTRHRYSSSH